MYVDASTRLLTFYIRWDGQTKDYKIGVCCFSDQHAALRKKNKDGLARKQDNMSE